MSQIISPLASKDELRKRFAYDKNLGVLCWKYQEDQSKGWNAKHVGEPVKTTSISGYLIAHDNPDEDGKRVHVQRIIYRWHHDFDESLYLVTHIDGDKKNNRIENLQLVKRAKQLFLSELPEGITTSSYGEFRLTIELTGLKMRSTWQKEMQPLIEAKAEYRELQKITCE